MASLASPAAVASAPARSMATSTPLRPRVLLLSNLFPNPPQPGRGIFTRQIVDRLQELAETTVVAPLPWFPGARIPGVKSDWSELGRVPRRYRIGKTVVYSPKYPLVPRLSDAIHDRLMQVAVLPLVSSLHRRFHFDVINAHWLYPDGVVAGRIARRLGIPCVLTGLGSDINYLTRRGSIRDKIVAASIAAQGVTVVSDPLKERLIELGVPAGSVTVIENGVDTGRFFPRAKAECRRVLGLNPEARYLLYVGRLVEVKGLRYLIEALRLLPAGERVKLLVAGDGPLRERHRGEVERLGLGGRVRFLGQVAYEDVPQWLGASDVFCLPSLDEGCPNVVLEALASGRPVVASAAGGIPQLVGEGSGVLVEPGRSRDLAAALSDVFRRDWDAVKIAASVAQRSWETTSRAYLEVMLAALQPAGLQETAL